MSRQFLLPDLGEGLTEAQIVSWRVSPGETVAVDQMIVEVESAKSVVELPCPFAGVVERLHGEPGQTLTAGDPLITVGDAVPAEDDGPADAPVGDTAASRERASADAERPGERAHAPSDGGLSLVPAAAPGPDVVPGTALRGEEPSGAVLIGYGTRERSAGSPRREHRRFGKGATATAPATAMGQIAPVERGTYPPPRERPVPGANGPATPPAAPWPPRNSPVVSPLVRRLAKEHGLDARHLTGTGPGNLVMRADVEAHIRELERERSGGGRHSPSSPSTQGVTPSAGFRVPDAEGDTRVRIDGVRKVIGERLSFSRREIPEATIWRDVDATELFRAKRRIEEATGERFSVLSLLARFVVEGLARFPILNSSVDSAAGEIVTHGTINLGLAAQTPRGLMVPVVHDAGALTTRELRDRIAGLVGKAEQGTFSPAELSGGTFTLNNYGPLGTDGSSPIINHPEVAMLGIGRIIDRPWVVDGELAVRKVGLLSMVFDHRVCDGADPAGFLAHVAGRIESPITFLADA